MAVSVLMLVIGIILAVTLHGNAQIIAIALMSLSFVPIVISLIIAGSKLKTEKAKIDAKQANCEAIGEKINDIEVASMRSQSKAKEGDN